LLQFRFMSENICTVLFIYFLNNIVIFVLSSLKSWYDSSSLKTKVYMCFIQSSFDAKLINYVLYNIFDKIFICKIKLQKEVEENMCK